MSTTFATPPTAPAIPGQSTDHALALFDGTTKQLKSGIIVCTDAGAVSGLGGLSSTGDTTLIGTLTNTGNSTLAGDIILGVSGNTSALNLRVPKQTTVGSAGGASALPATPTGYVEIKIQGTAYVLPYYDKT